MENSRCGLTIVILSCPSLVVITGSLKSISSAILMLKSTDAVWWRVRSVFVACAAASTLTPVPSDEHKEIAKSEKSEVEVLKIDNYGTLPDHPFLPGPPSLSAATNF